MIENEIKSVMNIVICHIQLHLPDAHSLKDKRSVIQSIIARLHNQFNISCAEVDHLDSWQLAGLGMAVVSNKVSHAQSVITATLNWIELNRPDVMITDHTIEVISGLE